MVPAGSSSALPSAGGDGEPAGIPTPHATSEYLQLFATPCRAIMGSHATRGFPRDTMAAFTGQRLFGDWFWRFHQEGSIASLGDLIATTPGTVFWVNTNATLRSGSCVVAEEIRSPQGYRVPRGRYVYYRALMAGTPLPSLGALLSDASVLSQ